MENFLLQCLFLVSLRAAICTGNFLQKSVPASVTTNAHRPFLPALRAGSFPSVKAQSVAKADVRWEDIGRGFNKLRHDLHTRGGKVVQDELARALAIRGARVAVRWTAALAQVAAAVAVFSPQATASAEWTERVAQKVRSRALKAKLVSGTTDAASDTETLVAASTAMAASWAIYLEVLEAGAAGPWIETVAKAVSVAARVQAEELVAAEGIIETNTAWAPRVWTLTAVLLENLANLVAQQGTELQLLDVTAR